MGLVLMLAACSSTPSGGGSGVLEAVENEKKTEGAEAVAPPTNPTLEKLLALLKTRGYDGIGLEYEAEATLDLLHRVFTDPKTSNRKIKLVYTGLAMSYDALHQSLTVGGTNDINQILGFIQKHVPAK
jgi:hypothetical protein